MNRDILRQACLELSPGDDHCFCLLDKVFWHDSHWGTAGQGARNNNPGNVRPLGGNSPYPHEVVQDTFTRGAYMAKFPDMKTGIYAAVELYSRKYRGLPVNTITFRWAQAQSGEYYAALRSCYQ